MSAHTGKIGRLPKRLREEVDQRLDNGEPGTEILVWLNGLPAVQAVLAARFGGKPISASNLTHWRTGGHQEWQKEQARLVALLDLMRNPS